MNKDYWFKIQTALKAMGFYKGEIDGDPGPLTTSAIIAFKRSVGLLPRDYVGPLTEAALFGTAKNPHPIDDKPEEPVWLRRARMDIGVQEIGGSRHNAKVLGYWERAKLPFRDDETPWCAGFVGAMLEECGLMSTRSGMARSYSNGWGIKLHTPVPGSVVVFWRGSPSSGSGHVAFVVGKDSSGNILCLGGNQSDAVNVKAFPANRVVGYYWPKGVPVPGTDLTTTTGTAPVSDRES